MDFRGKNIDIVGKQNLWFGISALVILVGLVSLALFGLNYGIDFKGGGQLTYLIPESKRPAGDDAALLNSVRQTLAPKGLDNAKIQISGGDSLVIVTDATDSASLESQDGIIRGALTEQFGIPVGEPIGSELVGPVIGRELKRNAIIGVLLGVLGIACWIYLRYNFAGGGHRYAIASIFALIHDLLVLVGLFALIGKIDPRIEVDGAFIAALLTVVGYSINDSVVIFDRIRENLRKHRKEDFNKVVNDSLLETMSRSINTGLTVLIMLVVMLMFGGESIYNFILAMLIGIGVGLYSSLFHASMILTAWHNWELKKQGSSPAPRTASTPATAAPAAPVTPRASTPATPRPRSTDESTSDERGSSRSRARRRF